MFVAEGLHREDHLDTIKHRQDNYNKEEVLHADGTILVSKSAAATNSLLAEVEEAVVLYGLKQN